jgi:hypothetical protein
MKCHNCGKECRVDELSFTNSDAGWTYHYCQNKSCMLGPPNTVPQEPRRKPVNTIDIRLAESKKRQGVITS